MQISGLGAVSCAGVGVDSLWRAAQGSESLIREGLGRVNDDELLSLTPHLARNRALAFCHLSAQEAMTQAGWSQLNERDGLILATTTGQFLQWDSAFIRFVDGQMKRDEFRQEFRHQPLGNLALALRTELNHSGPFSVVTSACTAATQALALASMWIQQGRVDRVLVGGVEVLCRLTCEGFKSLQLLSLEPARPFDIQRSGINLSEGAAFLCLERKAARSLAQLSGFGFSTDGYHMTSPHPEGAGSAIAMSQALQRAELTPQDIDWVHAHGTGSIHNDLAEGAALRQVFGAKLPLVSSTKWLHGHSLGASGAIEAALVVRALGAGRVLKTGGLENPDPAVGIARIDSDLEKPLKHVLKNTLGFGGANAALVFTC